MKSNLEHVQHHNAPLPGLPARQAWTAVGEFGWIAAGAGLLLLTVVAEPLRILAPLRLLLAAAYVLFVPGYCLGVALFPQRDDLSRVERIGLSLGLSVALMPLLALLLDRLPWGLRPWPIYGGVVSVTGLCVVLGLWRRQRLSVAERYVPAALDAARLDPYLRRSRALLAMGLLLALAVGWLLFAPAAGPQVTEFYMLGTSGLADGYPRIVRVGDTVELTIGIANREQRAQSYYVEIWAPGSSSNRSGELVGRAGPFELAPDETVQQTVAWRMPRAGEDQEIDLWLFSSAASGVEPYRQLRLWIDVWAPAPQ